MARHFVTTRSGDRRTNPWRPRALAWLALLLLLPVATSGAEFTSTSANPSTGVSSADWVGPDVSLASPGSVISGVVNLVAIAADSVSGVASVQIERSLAGADTWVTICTATVAPYSCAFSTTSVAEDVYDLRAIATDRSGNTTTSAVLTDILVDNTLPLVTMTDPGSPLRGTVTLGATASDLGSGIATISIQRTAAGGSTWVVVCTITAPASTCRADTTSTPDGLYDFRAQAVDMAGLTATSATIRNRQIDNTVSSVAVEDPGADLRGTVIVTATAYSSAGIVSVRIQRAPAGSTTWTDICTDTTSPYSCTWDTTTVAGGAYDLRAILLDGAGKTTTSTTMTNRLVDNSLLRGFDIQAANGGTAAGKLDTGDTLTFTWTRLLNLTTLVASWDGSSRAVAVRVRDGGLVGGTVSDDTIDVFTSTSLSTAVRVGTVNAKGSLVKNNKTAVFNGTMVASTTTIAGVQATVVTVRLGSPSSGSTSLTAETGTPTMVWTPSTLAKGTDGSSCSAAAVSEAAPADRDF